MDAAQLASTDSLFQEIRARLRRINRRQPEAAARLVDDQFGTADRVLSAYTLLAKARREGRQPTGFEMALATDAARCLGSLDLRQLRLPFWWKHGLHVALAAVALVAAASFGVYEWRPFDRTGPVSTASHLPANVQSLRMVARELGEAAGQAKEGNLAGAGEELVSSANYLDRLARTLGSSELVKIAAQIKMAGLELQKGDAAAAGRDLAQAGASLEGLTAGDISLAEAGHAFADAGRLLAEAGNLPSGAELKNLAIGLANDLLEAREVTMNLASKLEFYEDEQTLKGIESAVSQASSPDELYDSLADLGKVLKDLNSHLVQQSLPLMERNIPWQDLANLEKMTSGWDDTWPFYVPSAGVPPGFQKSPSGADPSLSAEDAKALYKALTEASQSIAQASQTMELMRVKSNPEDLAKIGQDLQSAEMALKEASKMARAVAANYITSIKLNVPVSFEDVTNPTATSIGPAWIYQQQEPNMGVSDLWKMRYVSSYYGALGIAGDQLGSAGEMLGSAYNMWTNASDIKAMQELKLGEEQLIGASKQMVMTLGNYEELKQLQNRLTAVESYQSAIGKIGQNLPGLEKATSLEGGLKALSAEMLALSQPFSVTPMYKPDVYYLLDEAGRKIGLAATQSGAQQKATIMSASQEIAEAADALFGTQEINLREYGQFLQDIASELSSTTAYTGGQYFLGPLRKVALDLRGLQELLGVQVKWQGKEAGELASGLDRTLVMGTVLLRPVSGNEQSSSPNLIASYYVEAPSTGKPYQLKYSGEMLTVPTIDTALAQSMFSNPTAAPLREAIPVQGDDLVQSYFVTLGQEGGSARNWIKKQVPVKPGQPHITVPPLPPDMPPRQPPSSGGGLNCPAVTSK